MSSLGLGILTDASIANGWFASIVDVTTRKAAELERTKLLEREQEQRANAEQAKAEAEQARAEAERELSERKLAEAAWITSGSIMPDPIPYSK